MKLFLTRHGEALSPEADPKCPLSEKGKKETELVANILNAKKLKISAIYHSEKLRARQTREIIGKALDLSVQQEQWLKPNDPIDPIMHEINAANKNLLIVSHTIS